MTEIIHKVGIEAKAGEIYHALTTDSGLAKWWTTDTSGAGGLGSVIQFRFNGGGPDFEVTELDSNRLVQWKCVGGGPDAWIGTKISFQLTTEEKQTFVRFTHSGWQEVTDFMAHCSTKWAVFLLSLKDAVETGEGRPFPNDTAIDHN